MCYRTATPTKDQLEGYFQKDVIFGNEVFDIRNFEHFFCADGFMMPMLPISTTETPRTVEPAMWKLLPHWVKTMEDAKKYANTLNATCENIFEKASYKNYISKYRALLWVTGFFETHHAESGATTPYFIKDKDGQPFTLGCIYCNWVSQETGEVIKTFSIITTPANDLMSEIHNQKKRMPLVIAPADRQKWLSPLSKKEIEDLMKPLPNGYLEGHPVSKIASKKGLSANVPESQNWLDV